MLQPSNSNESGGFFYYTTHALNYYKNNYIPYANMYNQPKYNESNIRKILHAVRAGLCNRSAAGYLGISETTFYNWFRLYPEFEARVERVRNQKKISLLKKMDAAKDYRATQWLLRHCYAGEFSPEAQEGLQSERKRLQEFTEAIDKIKQGSKTTQDATSNGGSTGTKKQLKKPKVIEEIIKQDKPITIQQEIDNEVW